MNNAQRVVLVVTLVLIVLSGIYPPWVYGRFLPASNATWVLNPGPRSFLFGSAERLSFWARHKDFTHTVRLDTRRLFMEWTVIAAAGGAAFAGAGFWKKPRRKHDHSEAQPS